MTALEVRGLQVQLGPHRILQGVNLEVAAGQRLALIGPNGAGKSTLFNAINGLLQPRHGQISLEGRSLLGLDPHQIVRRGLGRSFQISQFFGRLPVAEHLQIACLAALGYQAGRWWDLTRRLDRLTDVQRRVERLLDELGLSDVAQTPVGQLPYARQRMLELGMVLAVDPRVMLLDEPTAGMSRSETRQFVQRIDQLSRGRTLVLVEHDMSVVFELADRVAVLHEGRVLVCDSPQAVQAHEEVQRIYLSDREATC
jgi:branched-chain amino acid transport system ATP-binding protein